MEMLKKFFPLAFKAKDGMKLAVSVIIYILIDFVCGLVIGLLAKLPLIGVLFGLVGSVIGLYALIGIILSILVFLKVVK